MSVRIKRFLQAQYPELADLFHEVTTIPKLRRRKIPLPEALVRVVTGQMLSSQAAETIYGRISRTTAELQLEGSWLLDYEVLRNCGLSGAKARTVCEIGKRVGKDVSALDYWHGLSPGELTSEISSFRGMGDWTASIVALFYVGHEDIFPATDGSLQRAQKLIDMQLKRRKQKKFDPNKAAPFRSYLALYLWRALDTGLLIRKS